MAESPRAKYINRFTRRVEASTSRQIEQLQTALSRLRFIIIFLKDRSQALDLPRDSGDALADKLPITLLFRTQPGIFGARNLQAHFRFFCGQIRMFEALFAKLPFNDLFHTSSFGAAAICRLCVWRLSPRLISEALNSSISSLQKSPCGYRVKTCVPLEPR